MASETPLSKQIRINQLKNEQATYQRDSAVAQAKAEEIRQAQAELDQYNKDVIQYNADLENYNKELAEIEKQQAQYDADVSAYEKEKIRVEEGRKQVINQYKAQREEQNTKAELTKAEINARKPPPGEYDYLYLQSNRDAVQVVEKNLSDYNRMSNQDEINSLAQYDFRQAYPNVTLTRNEINQTKDRSAYNNLIAIHEKEIQRQQEQSQGAVARSQGIAQAQRETEKAKLGLTIEAFNQQKIKNDASAKQIIFNKVPTKSGDLLAKLEKPTKPERTLIQSEYTAPPPDPRNQQIFNAQQTAKQNLLDKTQATRTTKPIPVLDIQKPEIKNNAPAFLTKPPQDVNNIIGKTQSESNRAVFTFEQTQAQQKELFQKIQSAKTSQEAIALKEQYQKINPYVGTPQTATKNGGIVASQGTLIEKINISTKEEIKASYEPPKEITTITEVTTTTTTTKEKDLIKIKDAQGKFIQFTNSKGVSRDLEFLTEESAQKYIARTNKVITTEVITPSFYSFADEQGKPIKADSTILWKQANILIETKVKEPSKTDIEFNQSLRESLKTNPNLEIYKETKTAEPFIQDPLVKGLTDYGTEFVVMGEDVIKLANPNYEKKIKQTEHSLETVAFTEGIEKGKYLLAIPGATKPKESETKKYINEKLKTPEGQQYLAGSVIASVSVGIATGGYALLRQPLKAGVKEVNILKDIASSIFKPKIQSDYRTARLKELNPELTDYQIEKLSAKLYPTERTQKEITLTNMLKQNNPNISQERIDFIIEQTQKTDAIQQYQKQQGIKAELKQAYPGMSDKTLDQKVATMTAKENENIPYSIEKINEKSYLISAGRESKDTNTPFIVVNFNKSRFGKEQGTFEVYESAQGSFKPTDIIIQGVQKTELKGGQVISKSSSSTVTRYPIGKGNINKVLDENQKDLALIGTSKTGSLSSLKQYPKEVIDSMVKDERKTAILETKHEVDLLAKMETSARKAYDLGLKESKTTKTAKTETKTITKETTKETKPTIEIGKPGSNMQTPTPNKYDDIVYKKQQERNTEKLKDIARGIEKQKGTDAKNYQNIKSVSALGISQAGISSMRINTAQATNQAQGTRQQQGTRLKDIQIGQQRELTIQIPSKSEVTRQRDLITEKNVIKENITEKYKQVTTPRFSLITIPGLGQKTDQSTKLDIVTELTYKTEYKTETVFKYPTKPDEPFLKPRGLPGGIIIPDLTKKEKENKSLEGKKAKVVYFSWNVDLQNPGRYLPTQDLVIGTKTSVLNRTDKIQKQVSSAVYSKKQDQFIIKSMDKLTTKKEQSRSTKSFMKKEKPFKINFKL